MYLVNTPVGHEVPYYEITVRMNHFDYTAEYTPHHDAELPSEWVVGAVFSARLEKHVLFLKRSDGSELRSIISKRHPASEKQD